MDVQGRVSTIPPGAHGGNIDNWRIGAGAVMYYPVQVEGGLFPRDPQGHAPLGIVSRDPLVENADAEVEAVEDGIHGEAEDKDAVPDGGHDVSSAASA